METTVSILDLLVCDELNNFFVDDSDARATLCCCITGQVLLSQWTLNSVSIIKRCLLMDFVRELV